MTERPAHSPLGASGAERWMACPGSVTLLKRLDLPVSDEPDYTREGTAAHEAACHCLREGLDAWEVVGEKFYNVEVTVEMTQNIQLYLDTCRPLMNQPGAQVYIEKGIDLRVKNGYGTVDCGVVLLTVMDVNDYKNGAGVMVDVENNPQIMYYAYGLLLEHPEVTDVRLRIIQPRGFHPDGPVRLWTTTAAYIRDWAEGHLLPAMLRTKNDQSLDVGKHCRFCPAKLVCPAMRGLFGAALKANPKHVVNISDEDLDRDYPLLAALESYIKAHKEEIYRRLCAGKVLKWTKLIPKKSNRVFKSGATTVFREAFGDEALHPAELKSPAEMEKLNAQAKALVKEWAFKPDTGVTVALATDKNPAVKVETAKEAFKYMESEQ